MIAAGRTRVLSYSIVARRLRDGRVIEEPVAVPEEVVFQEGDGIRITLTSSQPGHLYLVNESPVLHATTTLPVFTVVFPKPTANGGSAELAANQTIQIPDRTWIEFFGAKGVETLWLVWSEQDLDALNGLGSLVTPARKGRVTDPVTVRALQDILARHAVSSPALDTDATRNVATLHAQGDVLVHALHFAHQ